MIDQRILVIGAGGLGSPIIGALVEVCTLPITILDDDRVDVTNLHRQTLFDDGDVGRSKAAVLRERFGARVDARAERFVPENAMALVREHDLVIEGADNFATKFLAADACALAGVPLAQAGVVRWSGWAFASVPGASACLRCVFEDLPRDRVETCAEAGVVGPVVGVLAGAALALALRIALGDETAGGTLVHYRGLEGRLRARAVRRREGCALCRGDVTDLHIDRYAAPCAA